MSLVGEKWGLFQLFSDGSVKRFTPETVPASTESSNGYKFKDIIIDSSKPITARLFLPDSQDSTSRLPIVLYFHGGWFCFGSTTWLGFHHFLGDLSVASKSIVLSVDYRLAPEHRLPTAFDDCYSSIEWLCDPKNSEIWLKQADLSRVFLMGDSAGGNIAHQLCVRATTNKISNIKIQGLVTINPFFGSDQRTEKEVADGAEGEVASNDMFWQLSLPKGSNRDYFGCNFEKQELPAGVWSDFPAVGIYVAGLDFLYERAILYEKFLAKKGVKEVTLVVAEGEAHNFHVFHPESQATRVLQRQLSEFLNNHLVVAPVKSKL